MQKKKNSYIDNHRNVVEPELIHAAHSQFDYLQERYLKQTKDFGKAYYQARVEDEELKNHQEEVEKRKLFWQQLEKERFDEAITFERSKNYNIELDKLSNRFQSSRTKANNRESKKLHSFKKTQVQEKKQKVKDIEESQVGYEKAFKPQFREQDFSHIYQTPLGSIPKNRIGDHYGQMLAEYEEADEKLKNEMKVKVNERTSDAIRRRQTEKQNRMLEDELLVISETETAVVLEMLKRQARADAHLQETNLS